MLLSPIGSPSKLQAFRCQPLPPLGFDDDDGAYLYDEEPDLRLPVELWLVVFGLLSTDPEDHPALSGLVSATCLCRALQPAAEEALYRRAHINNRVSQFHAFATSLLPRPPPPFLLLRFPFPLSPLSHRYY